MAYQIIPGDIAQLTIRYAQSNIVTSMNVLHYRYLGPTAITDGAMGLEDLAQYFRTLVGTVGWSTRWASLASNLVVVDRYDAQKIYPTRFGIVTVNVSDAGTVVQNPLPGLVQYSLTKRGEIAAKYAVGGVRVPGLAEGLEEGSILQPATLTLANSLASLLALNMTPNPGNEWEPIIYRRLAAGSSVRVHTAFAQQTLRSQRTRIAFRGI